MHASWMISGLGCTYNRSRLQREALQGLQLPPSPPEVVAPLLQLHPEASVSLSPALGL